MFSQAKNSFKSDPSLQVRFRRIGFLGLIGILGPSLVWAQKPVTKNPPETRKDNVKEVLHGVEIIDPYRWLEDQQSPETRAWVKAQNAYTQFIFGSIPGREDLKVRVTELMKIVRMGMPVVAP